MGLFSGKKPPFEIEEINYAFSENKTESFCTIKLKIKSSDISEFKIKFSPKDDNFSDKPEGILFIPCDKFEGEADGRAQAKSIFNSHRKTTNWDTTYGHDIFSDKNSSIDFSHKGQRSNKDETFEFGMYLKNYYDFKIKYYDRKFSGKEIPHQKEITDKTDQQHRFDWVSKLYDAREIKTKSDPLIQLHPKQEATNRAIRKSKSSGFKANNKSIVTYVGLDDSANFVTAMNELTDGANVKINSIDIRSSKDEDLSANQDWFEKKAMLFSENNPIINSHNKPWGKSDFIIDTYTAMLWPTSEKEVRDELKNRFQSLRKEGYVSLTIPDKKEAFGESPQTLYSKASIEGAIVAINADNNFEVIIDEGDKQVGNANYYLFKKTLSEEIEGLEVIEFPQIPFVFIRELAKSAIGEEEVKSVTDETIQTGLTQNLTSEELRKLISYGEEIEWNIPKDSVLPQEIITLAKNCCKAEIVQDEIEKEIETFHEVSDFDGFGRACRSLPKPGKGSEQFPKPIIIKAIDDIKDNLEQVMKGGAESILLLQGESGWGKTSMLGEALTEYFEDDDIRKRFFVVTLEQAKALKKFPQQQSSNFVVIIDDLHKYWPDSNNKNHEIMVQDVLEISLHVHCVIITCRVNEMGGNIKRMEPWRSNALIPNVIGPNSVQELEQNKFCNELFDAVKVRFGKEQYTSLEGLEKCKLVDTMNDNLFVENSSFHPRKIKMQLEDYLHEYSENPDDSCDFEEFLNPKNPEDRYGSDDDSEDEDKSDVDGGGD